MLVAARERVVSAATPLDEILRLHSAGTLSAPLYVLDEEGRLVGEIRPSALLDAAGRCPLPETTTAADLANGVTAIDATAPPETLTETLTETMARRGRTELPLVAPSTGRLVGIVRTRRD